MSELHEFARVENDADGFKLVAVGFGQQGGRGRRRREDRLIHAEHKSELQFGIARAVDGADQHLIERGWNYADGQAPQARFQNRQPFAQRQRLAGKRQRDVFEPRLHLRPHRRVNC